MSNPVLDEKKILEINSQLIKLGKKRGYLTYDEINNSFEQVQLDPEMISYMIQKESALLNLRKLLKRLKLVRQKRKIQSYYYQILMLTKMKIIFQPISLLKMKLI